MFKIQINIYNGGALMRCLDSDKETKREKIIDYNSMPEFIGERVLAEVSKYNNKDIFMPGNAFLIEVNLTTSTKFKEGEVFL